MIRIVRNAPLHEGTPLIFQGRAAWSPQLQAFARQRLGRALGRFEKRIRTVTVWLEDVNGPRGGIDKLCRIEIRLVRHGRLTVTGQAESAQSAIAQAALRARRLMVRRLKSRRTERHLLPQTRHRSIRRERQDMTMQANTRVMPEVDQLLPDQVVTIGTVVTIVDPASGDREVYTLVRPDEADVTLGRISSLTPAGSALYGRRAGETVKIDAPGGTTYVRIEKVEAQPIE